MSSLFGNSGLGQQSSAPTSNLFGNAPSASSQRPSPFSFPQTTQPAGAPSAGGLFGNTGGTTTSAPAPGGLFGSTATTQPQQTTSSLFSGLNRTQPPQPSGLFGTSTAAVTQPPQTGTSGLFGGLGTSQQPASQPAALGSSLLAPSQTQQPAQNTQAVDVNTQSKAATSLHSAYFDQILERGRKRNNQENGVNGLGDLPTLQLGLGDIARKVRNLGQGGPTVGRGSDSRAHYLLAASGVSTSAALRDLNSLNAQAGSSLPTSSNNLSDTDIESFVSGLQTQTTLDLIQQGLEQSKRDFDTFLEENVQMNWDAQRLKIYEHFGLAKPSDTVDDGAAGSFGVSQRERGAFGRSSRRNKPLGTSSAGMSFGPGGLARSVLGNSAMRSSNRQANFTDLPENGPSSSLAGGSDDRLQRDKQEKYAIRVRELTGARNSQDCYPILHHFAEVEQSAGIDHTHSLVSAYQALISISEEAPEPKSSTEPGVIKERHYVKQYLDDSSTSLESMAMRKQILQGSRKCLESIYLKKVKDVVAKDPRAAQVGGTPDTASQIRGYVRVLQSRKEFGETASLQVIENEDGNDELCWAIVYTFLRCGLVDEAADYVEKFHTAIQVLDRKFHRYIQDYARSPDRQLSRENRAAINSEYSRTIKAAADGSLDPYRLACHKIIGRCELSRRVLDDVRTDEDDWLWLQFVLAREVSRSEEQAGEVFGLEQVRETITDIGKRHFAQAADNAGSFGLFFFMQILAGMFEKAVAWLYPQNHITAVHVAIALDYYGLLRVADLSATELLSYTTRQQPRLNFALMIGYYTSDFRTAKPEAAADYLCLINLNSDLPGEAGLQQAKICWEALRELVLETREFATLLGDLREDGTRVNGAIEQRGNLIKLRDDYVAGKRKIQDGVFDNKKFIDELTVQAAIAADEGGRTTDAVLLYHLAGDFNAVINIINRTLSEALTVPVEAGAPKIEATKPASDPQGHTANRERSTFSLATVDDPFVLAHNFWSLYSANAILTRHIKESSREACGILMSLAEAKRLLQESLTSAPPRFTAALDRINETRLLPLNARGDIGVIRTFAQNFAKQPQVVARTVGDVMLWAIQCLKLERQRLASSEFVDTSKVQLEKELEKVGKDLVVFAGLVRFRLSPHVFEVLAKEAGDST